MNATIEKFGYPATLIAQFDHWLVLLRPALAHLAAAAPATEGADNA